MDFNHSKWVYLVGFLLILFLPLLNLPPWFSPPDWGKTIVFRIILSTLVFALIYQLLFKYYPNLRIKSESTNVNPSLRTIKKGVVFWLLITLFIIFLLATIFSLDPHFSFWGNPYRSGGFLNFAFYIIFAILAFLILRKSDWQKIWDFAIFIGILVSLVAIFQFYGVFSKFLIPFSGRPPSTVGGPIFLAIYLLLLSFLTLSFGIKTKNLFKRFFYFLSFLLFVFVAVFITQTRAAMVGFTIGFLYFLIFYPFKKFWLSATLKIAALIFLILGIYGIYYLNTQPQLPEFIQENKILRGTVGRLSIKAAQSNARISAWRVSWQALKNRPILGYGPENFSIGFDKYYDPSLPKIEKMPGGVTSWWDRAHNFIFDIGITAGIPALIIYLSLFGVLFWQLQKLKYYPNGTNLKSESTNNAVVCHGIQTTFLAYLTANLFSFDTFSTYLISFLLIGYSLHLISSGTAERNADNHAENTLNSASNQRINRRKFSDKILVARIYSIFIKWKMPIFVFLLVILTWFIWDFNLKPFRINSQINRAVYESKNNRCEIALNRMEKILPEHPDRKSSISKGASSFLDNYLRLRYASIIQNCAKENIKATKELAQKATKALKENIKIRPYYTRNWLLLGSYTNVLIEKEIQSGKDIQSGSVQDLKKEANIYFEKALQLSPKRQEILTGWARTDLLTGEYKKAEEKSQKCIDLNKKFGECYWLMALSQAGLKNIEKSEYYMKDAKEKGFNTQSKNSLYELIEVYIKTKNYSGLVKVYSKLIKIEPSNSQYHASLAVAYKKLGEFEKAKKEALRVLELKPEAKEEVERFLRTLSE